MMHPVDDNGGVTIDTDADGVDIDSKGIESVSGILNMDRCRIETLSVAKNKLASLPSQICQLFTLRVLNVSSNQLTSLPAEIGKLTALKKLYLGNNQLTSLPAEIGKLTALGSLHVRSNQLTSLPAEIGKLTALEKLYVGENQLTSLPAEIGELTALHYLAVDNNQLTSLPAEIGKLTALGALSLGENQLTSLPAEIGKLTALHYLAANNNQLTSLPAEIGKLNYLEKLYVGENQLTSLPAEIGKLTALEELHVGENQLTSLPAEIGELCSLEKLHVDNNQLTSLPAEIGKLTALHYLAANNNQLTSLPTEIGKLTALESLALGENQLTSLPTEIGKLTALRYLAANNNQLTSLPTEIGKLNSLYCLDLRCNQLTCLPLEIGQLTAKLDDIWSPLDNIPHPNAQAFRRLREIGDPQIDTTAFSDAPLEPNPKYPPLDESFGRCVIITNLPKVPSAKFEKLSKVVLKLVSRIGSLAAYEGSDDFSGFFMPQDEKGDTVGCAYVEYQSGSDAKKAIEVLEEYKFDKTHALHVTLHGRFSEIKDPQIGSFDVFTLLLENNRSLEHPPISLISKPAQLPTVFGDCEFIAGCSMTVIREYFEDYPIEGPDQCSEMDTPQCNPDHFPETLQTLGKSRHSKFIGQVHIMAKLKEKLNPTACNDIFTRSTGSKAPRVILFNGAPGCGKTELAGLVAEVIHKRKKEDLQDEGLYKSFSMGQMATSESGNTFYGAAPGYAGGEGSLYALLKKKTDAVVVLDEIEKAHSSIRNQALLSIFNGSIHSNSNLADTVSTSKATFILTCNLDVKTNDYDPQTGEIQPNVFKGPRNHRIFEDPMCSRLGAACCLQFRPASNEDHEAIVRMTLSRIRYFFSQENETYGRVDLEWTTDAIKCIAKTAGNAGGNSNTRSLVCALAPFLRVLVQGPPGRPSNFKQFREKGGVRVRLVENDNLSSAKLFRLNGPLSCIEQERTAETGPHSALPNTPGGNASPLSNSHFHEERTCIATLPMEVAKKAASDTDQEFVALEKRLKIAEDDAKKAKQAASDADKNATLEKRLKEEAAEAALVTEQHLKEEAAEAASDAERRLEVAKKAASDTDQEFVALEKRLKIAEDDAKKAKQAASDADKNATLEKRLKEEAAEAASIAEKRLKEEAAEAASDAERRLKVAKKAASNTDQEFVALEKRLKIAEDDAKKAKQAASDADKNATLEKRLKEEAAEAASIAEKRLKEEAAEAASDAERRLEVAKKATSDADKKFAALEKRAKQADKDRLGRRNIVRRVACTVGIIAVLSGFALCAVSLGVATPSLALSMTIVASALLACNDKLLQWVMGIIWAFFGWAFWEVILFIFRNFGAGGLASLLILLLVIMYAFYRFITSPFGIVASLTAIFAAMQLNHGFR